MRSILSAAMAEAVAQAHWVARAVLLTHLTVYRLQFQTHYDVSLRKSTCICTFPVYFFFSIYAAIRNKALHRV
jgi:hypothetical protein